jgi:sec-independent protein translocase protein TatA
MGLDNPLHIAFLVVILLLVFGARRLPEIGRSLGSGLREFKQSINGESHGRDHEQPKLPSPQASVQAQPPTQVPTPAQPPVAERQPAPTDQR